jgi:hypothetical protein
MATTGELRAIIQELHLVDVGDAKSYLGEEAMAQEEIAIPLHLGPAYLLTTNDDHLATCDCNACQLIHA